MFIIADMKLPRKLLEAKICIQPQTQMKLKHNISNPYSALCSIVRCGLKGLALFFVLRSQSKYSVILFLFVLGFSENRNYKILLIYRYGNIHVLLFD